MTPRQTRFVFCALAVGRAAHPAQPSCAPILRRRSSKTIASARVSTKWKVIRDFRQGIEVQSLAAVHSSNDWCQTKTELNMPDWLGWVLLIAGVLLMAAIMTGLIKR